uniref:Uncharacterized protein n=1 Tax=Labrus bergylta TaxID=56723 RepID=A0A3Q3GRA5_9LABR
KRKQQYTTLTWPAERAEFLPRGAPPEAMPVVLWNKTDLATSNVGRGRLLRGGKVWVAERVRQADQGNYTIRDDKGKALSRSTLTVRGEFVSSKIKCPPKPLVKPARDTLRSLLICYIISYIILISTLNHHL